jgi:hypothetical protein
MKKIINLSPSDIDYVTSVAKTLCDPRAKVKFNFTKGLRKIIEDHKEITRI